MIDLHQHTILSDGTDSVEELITKNKNAGVQVMAITDHDNIESIYTSENLGIKYDISIISGVEFSTNYNGESIHILCYGFDSNDKIVRDLIDESMQLRRRRVAFRLDILKNEFNIKLDNDTIEKINQSPNPNRPMIANILKNFGYGENISEIIKKYLYHKMPEFKLKTTDVLKKLSCSSGLSVYAHPLGGVGEKRVERKVFEERLQKFIDAGLNGLECYYSLYSKEEQTYLVSTANKNGLLISGGSDYHGTNKNVHIAELSSDNHSPQLNDFTILKKLI